MKRTELDLYISAELQMVALPLDQFEQVVLAMPDEVTYRIRVDDPAVLAEIRKAATVH